MLKAASILQVTFHRSEVRVTILSIGNYAKQLHTNLEQVLDSHWG